MGRGGGRGVYMCTSVIMARAARSHRSEPGRPLLSLLLGGRVRGDAARDADVLLERPRSNCGSCSICSRYVCPGVYQRQQVGPDYLTARSPSTALRLRVYPCERVFHAQVCALHCTHLSIPVAHQRQRHDGRACPCERVFHAQVCALQVTHISILAARQRQPHDGRACPCERVFHARVCALHRTHFSILVAHQRQRHAPLLS